MNINNFWLKALIKNLKYFFSWYHLKMISWKFHSFSFYSFLRNILKCKFFTFFTQNASPLKCIEFHFQYPCIIIDYFILYNTGSLLFTSAILFHSKPSSKMTNPTGNILVISSICMKKLCKNTFPSKQQSFNKFSFIKQMYGGFDLSIEHTPILQNHKYLPNI